MPILASFDEIVQGFRNIQGPVLPVLLIMVVPVAILAVVAVVQVRRSRRIATERAETGFRQALKRKNLNATQLSVAEALAHHVPDQLRRHELLSNHRVFQVAADRALRSSSVGEDDVAGLRVTLGFLRTMSR